MTANQPGQFKRTLYMALGGIAIILAVGLAGYDVQPRAVRQRTLAVPDAGSGPRLREIADSLRRDSLGALAASKSSASGSRIAVRDSEAARARSRRIAAALVELRERQLIVPVLGITVDRLRDSFDHWRSGGTRRHNAIDLLAPHGTPVVAADSGTILQLSRSTLGGISLYAADPHRRFVYYYAHLDSYHPSIAEGITIARGDTLGFVGTTGNAPSNSPHLHFAIFRTDNVDRWYSGIPINPLDVFVPERSVPGGS